MRLLVSNWFDRLGVHHLEILCLHHLGIGLLLNRVRLLWSMMFSLVSISIWHQVGIKDSLLALVVDVVIIWNLLILHFVYHRCSLISIWSLKDILVRNLSLLLLLLSRNWVHVMDSRRLMSFIHFLKSEDRLRLVVVRSIHWVRHRLLLSSLLLILLLLMKLLLWLQLCGVVVAACFTLMHTRLFGNWCLGLTLGWLGIVHLRKDRSGKSLIRNVIVLTFEKTFELVAKKSKEIGYHETILG